MRGCLAPHPVPGALWYCRRPFGHSGDHEENNGPSWRQRFDDSAEPNPDSEAGYPYTLPPDHGGYSHEDTHGDTWPADAPDMVAQPPHYTSHPSGIECIQVTEHMNFCRGNAVKYIWRAGDKGDEIEDLRKARWYLDREIARLEAQNATR